MQSLREPLPGRIHFLTLGDVVPAGSLRGSTSDQHLSSGQDLLGFFDVVDGKDKLDHVVILATEIDGVNIDASIAQLLSNLGKLSSLIFDDELENLLFDELGPSGVEPAPHGFYVVPDHVDDHLIRGSGATDGFYVDAMSGKTLGKSSQFSRPIPQNDAEFFHRPQSFLSADTRLIPFGTALANGKIYIALRGHSKLKIKDS